MKHIKHSDRESDGRTSHADRDAGGAAGAQSLLERVLSWALRRRGLVIGIVVTATIVFGAAAFRLTLNTDFSTYLAKDSEVVREFRRAGEVFGLNYLAMVVFRPSQGDLFSYSNLSKLQQLTAEYRAMEGVDSVVSLINAPYAQATSYGVSVGSLVGERVPQDEEALRRIRQRSLEAELFRGVLLDSEGKSTVLLVGFAEDVDHVGLARRLIAATEPYMAEEREFVFGGMPFAMFAMSEGIAKNIVFLVPGILLLLAGILYVGLRSWQGVLFPLLVVLISAVWVLGLMALFGAELDMLTSVVPVILIAMGSADAIHLMKRMGERRGSTPDRVREAVAELALPMILTSVTTMAGFASLAVSNFDIIKRFGLATSVAIFIALVISLFFLPALAGAVGLHSPAAGGRMRDGKLMGRLADLVYRRRRPVLVGGVLVLVAAVIAIPLIVVNVDWSLCLPRGSSPHEAEMTLRDRFGGSLPMQISMRGDIKSPALLNRMRAIETYADSLPLIDNSVSVATMIAELNYVLNGRYSIPESAQGVANLWLLLEGQETLRLMVTSDRREALIQGRVGNMATSAIRESALSVESYLAAEPRQLVLVDGALLSGSGSSVLGRLQAETVTELLDQTLGPTDQKQLIESAILAPESSGWPIDRQRLERRVAAYLTGDLSPVPLPAGASTARLAAAVSLGVTRASLGDIPDEQALRAALAGALPGVSAEDLSWLAESLRLEMREYVRERRVELLYGELQDRLGEPIGSAELQKEVLGALWQLQSDQVAVSAEEFRLHQSDLAPGRAGEAALSASMTGMVPVLNQMERELTPTQIKSVGLTLGVILVLLIVVFRSVKAGIIGVVPTLLTILTNFAVLGYGGIGLDSFTVLIASVVIGLGIDYTIHFYSRLRLELGRQGSQRLALRRTMQTTGVAILINALSVGLGFEVLLLAADQHLRLLGGLLGLSLIVSALYTLTILPALLLSTKSGPRSEALRRWARMPEGTEQISVGGAPHRSRR